MSTQSEALTSALLGTAVGDALGLPAEGMSRAAIRKRWRGEWRMRLIFGHGMLSDDTEHSVMVALSLLEHPTDVDAFQQALARKLRWWFAAAPPATGLATARACLKLWLGLSPRRSGVFSAGNGPAMRSAVIGAFHADDENLRRACVRASTRITHTDPRAETAAQAVALAAACAVREGSSLDADRLLTDLPHLSTDDEWRVLMNKMQSAWQASSTVDEFAAALSLERGVSGYAYHTVPMAIYAWLRHRTDFRAAVTSVLDCGGDTDSTGAITAALAAISNGIEQIPAAWLSRIMDWPLRVSVLKQIGGGTAPRLITGSAVAWPFVLLRNLVFLGIALVHGLYRLVF